MSFYHRASELKWAVILGAALMMTACAKNPADDAAQYGVAAPGSPQDFATNVGDRVFFETDSSDLTPTATATLDKQARWLSQYQRYSFTIEWTFGAIQDHSNSAEPFMTRIAAWPASSAGAERERSTTHPVRKGKRPRAFHAQSVEDRGEWNRILDRAKGSLPVVQSSPEGLESIALSGLFPRSSRYTVQAT